jgi:hypothetical protein
VSLTTFRQNLQTALATDLAIAFVPGRLEGPVETRDLGCVYAAAKAAVGGHVDDEQIELRVRVFKQYERYGADPEVPWDPAPLEALEELLQTSVKTHATSLGPWFARWTATTFDIPRQGFEATVIGIQHSLAELP